MVAISPRPASTYLPDLIQAYISRYHNEHGSWPVVAQIAVGVGRPSSTVNYYLRDLEARGALELPGRGGHGVRLTGRPPRPPAPPPERERSPVRHYAPTGSQDSPKLGQILNLVRSQWAQGRSLGIREIQLRLGISSTSVVDYNVKILVRRGLLTHEPNTARSIRPAGDEWQTTTRPVIIGGVRVWASHVECIECERRLPVGSFATEGEAGALIGLCKDCGEGGGREQ